MHFIIAILNRNLKKLFFFFSFLSATSIQVELSSNTSLDVTKGPIGSSSTYDELLITHSSIGTSTDEIDSAAPTVEKLTKSVASQMTLAELLDEIDVNQVMESAVRRSSPEAILLQYKVIYKGFEYRLYWLFIK